MELAVQAFQQQLVEAKAWASTASAGSLALVGTGVILLAALVHLVVTSTLLRWRLRHIPGPTEVPIVGHVPFMVKAPWMQFAKWATEYGSVYRLWVFNKLYVVISDPQLVQETFNTRKENYPKDDWSYQFMEPVLGRGLVTSEGARWRKHKELLKPAFHYTALERLHPIFSAAASRFVNQINGACAGNAPCSSLPTSAAHGAALVPTGRGSCDVELSGAFRQVTLEVISAVALGLSPEKAGVFPYLFETILDELNHRVFAPYRVLWPPNYLSHARRVKALNGIVYGMIASRRAAKQQQQAAAGKAVKAGSDSSSSTEFKPDDNSGEGSGVSISGLEIFSNGTDILDMILDSGAGLTDADIADEVKTQLLAGHETSSMMMTWTCYLLAKHPESLARAVAEVDAKLGLLPGVRSSGVPDAKPVADPAFASFKELSFMECCLKEAMRLYSPVPVLARETVGWDTLAGKAIPPRTAILVSIWAMHKSEAIWGADVDDFKPDRFRNEAVKGRHPYSYMPFSLGPRVCIGQHLALMEAKVVMGTLLRNYSITLKPGQRDPVTDSYIIPIRPKDGLHIILTPRK